MTAIKRFYETFKPEHYDLYFDISRANKIIKGQTKITGTALQADIALHEHDLTVQELKVNGQAVDFQVDNDQDAIFFNVGQAGQVTIEVTYSAPLTDNMNGIYPSYYEVNGESKQLVGTQFETYFARQAFPSIDEPEAKATFSTAIRFDEQPGETVIANMPEDHENDGVHYFQKTVKMSTYLVAFVLGDLQSKQTQTKSGVEVGVFSTKAHPIADLDFALDIAKRSIEFYEDYYQTPYPLPHSWQVALPDFSAGAMENWGIVTYREAYLLVDSANTALSVKQVVATVIAHELAHQWFGDLVTMKWWDELWLNESFANMMEFVAINALEPDWHIWESFNANDVQAALKRDATDGVQPVHVAVNHPAEIDALFDPAIVYAKGARLLVMVRSLIGDDALRQGLKAYFAKMSYGNASGADLWEALGQASGQNIGEVMKTWLEQPGYPVVSVKLVDGHVVLHQEQFNIGKQADADRLWQIPLNSTDPNAPKLMDTADLDLGSYDDILARTDGSFRLNVGNAAHYIVQYDERLLADLLEDFENFDPITQAQFLQDNLLLAEGGRTGYADLLWLLPNLADSSSSLVIDLVYRIVSQIKDFVTPGSEEEQLLKEFVAQLSANQIARLGWQQKDTDSNEDLLIRPTVLAAGVYGEDAAVLAQAHAQFEAVKGQVAQLPADSRSAVLVNEIKNNQGTSNFADFLELYQKSANASLKADLRTALTSSKDSSELQSLVDNFQNAAVIKPQDLRGWFAGVLANSAGQQAAWDWLKAQWPWLEERLGGDMEFSSYVTVISRIFHTQDRLTEFKTFFTPKIDQPGLSREIQMDIDIIASRVAVIEEQANQVAMTLRALVR
ncbi:M1 family metallopeptidase [Convivina intestini]|uniref:Aminopeptidase n=1 Tax=Convivina intestini TaxID=1505726 RepID=A0A2U1DCM7_9LACO|nr:M1 family metallopeptidase [Convivina intestini]PVY85417.1 lysyl aminopeptidase [Convivina intestini]CAH1853146.1 Aminopeptidase N [Convivina intestini]SDB85341.1 aminopeptidase N [Leuconostocaceae bacterium R-53105]